MNCGAFKLFMERVFEVIPVSGTIPLKDIVKQFENEPGGYGRGDAKASLLALKEAGRIDWDSLHNIERRLGGGGTEVVRRS